MKGARKKRTPKPKPKRVMSAALATPEQWAEIRRAYEQGLTYQQLVEIYGIKYGTIVRRACVESWIKPTHIIKPPRKPRISKDAIKECPTAQEAIAMTLGEIRVAHEVPMANWLQRKLEEGMEDIEAPSNWKEFVPATKLLRTVIGLDKPQIAIAINPFGISASKGGMGGAGDTEWEEVVVVEG